mmetsp:Transcript_31787/g.69556  ORF Transcript_31787/g.69556 Transcript_31787/m.69556 type:complete len:238 (+) Transcript_31787:786-1499(+)
MQPAGRAGPGRAGPGEAGSGRAIRNRWLRLPREGPLQTSSRILPRSTSTPRLQTYASDHHRLHAAYPGVQSRLFVLPSSTLTPCLPQSHPSMFQFSANQRGWRGCRQNALRVQLSVTRTKWPCEADEVFAPDGCMNERACTCTREDCGTHSHCSTRTDARTCALCTQAHACVCNFFAWAGRGQLMQWLLVTDRTYAINTFCFRIEPHFCAVDSIAHPSVDTSACYTIHRPLNRTCLN